MATIDTEGIIALYRSAIETMPSFADDSLTHALLDLADQRDELVQACEAALSMLERMEIDFADDIAEGWGDEGADEMAGIIEYIRDALEKARSADGDD